MTDYQCIKYSHFVLKASERNMMMIFVLLIEFRFVKMTTNSTFLYLVKYLSCSERCSVFGLQREELEALHR